MGQPTCLALTPRLARPTGAGFLRGTAETALLGSFLVAVSALPLTHGLLVPDVLYGPNDATLVAALAAVPAGSLALLPWLAPDSRWANTIVGHWRRFVVAHLIMIFSLAVLLLTAPRLVPLPPAGSLPRVGIIAFSVGACAVAWWRHVSLAVISQLGARIVAVCDGFDAMSQTRQYRTGMKLEDVRSIMMSGAGSQWDERLVALLWRLVDSEVHNADREVLDDVGRSSDPPGEPVLDCCTDAIPV